MPTCAAVQHWNSFCRKGYDVRVTGGRVAKNGSYVQVRATSLKAVTVSVTPRPDGNTGPRWNVSWVTSRYDWDVTRTPEWVFRKASKEDAMQSRNPVFARAEGFNGRGNAYGNTTYPGNGPQDAGYSDPSQWGTGTPGTPGTPRSTRAG